MNILVIAAHPDDEVLGVGGTIAKLAKQGHGVDILIVTEGCTSQYPDRPEMIAQKQREARRAGELLGARNVLFGSLPDMKLDTLASTEVTKCIEKVVRDRKPQWVFTQAEHDINLDHRIVYAATMVACRPYSTPWIERIYTYYTPSSSEWGTKHFEANTYCDIRDTIEAKVKAMTAYESEVRPLPHPRNPEMLCNIAAYFGSTVGLHFVEPFCLIRDSRLL